MIARRLAAILWTSMICCNALVSPRPSFAQSNLVDRPKHSLLAVVSIQSMSADNRELAQQLEIWDLLVELYDRNNPPSLERKLALKEKIRETIFESYLDAESVQAEADREQAILEAVRQTLTGKRDRNVELNNATNFIASGTLNTVGSILGFSNAISPFPGNLNQMLSGVVAAGMSMYALKQANGARTSGQGHPTILAELFGRPFDERTTYPESVWRFFHGSVPNHSSKTRVQLLEDNWIERQHLEKHGARREQLKLDLVCGLSKQKKCMTLDDLNDLIFMVQDVSALAGLMSHHLRDLLSMTDSDVLQTD